MASGSPLFGDAPGGPAGGQCRAYGDARDAVGGGATIDIASPDVPTEADGVAIIRYEFKFDLNDYLARTPGAPVRTLSDILAKA